MTKRYAIQLPDGSLYAERDMHGMRPCYWHSMAAALLFLETHKKIVGTVVVV